MALKSSRTSFITIEDNIRDYDYRVVQYSVSRILPFRVSARRALYLLLLPALHIIQLSPYLRVLVNSYRLTRFSTLILSQSSCYQLFLAKKRFLRQVYMTNKDARGACIHKGKKYIYIKETYMESHRFSIELSKDFSLCSAIQLLFL